MNIVVLCAGISTEREVSIVTGNMVCKALRNKGHNARVLDVYFGTYKNDKVCKENYFEGDYDLDSDILHIKSLSKEVKDSQKVRTDFFGENVIDICKSADIVFMALHGENGENGKVQAAFDLFGIKYTGTGYIGSALAMDKSMTKQLFVSNNIPTPKGLNFTKQTQYPCILESLKNENIKFPCVVKPCCGGSSVGVSIPKDEVEFKNAVADAFRFEDEIVVEEYVDGREFSIGIIEHKALPIIEIAPIEGFYDYKNKYLPGKTNDTCPAAISETLTKKMQECAINASEVLQLDTYCRIDFLCDKDENIYCIEANTLPGMTPTSLLPQEAAAVGMDFETLCEKLIKVSMK